jgi:type VI secretion system protein ImpA
LAPHVGAPVEGGDEAASTDAAGGGAAVGGGARAVSVPGAVNSRADVVQTIERLCEYYRQNEPSSPVPLILHRAQRMVHMSFMEIVTELTPDAVTTVKVVTGPVPGETVTT